MRPPNLLFLMSDQQRADTVEPGTPCPTPHLDGLAAGRRAVRPLLRAQPHLLADTCQPHDGSAAPCHGMVDCTHTVPDYRARLLPELPFWPRAAATGRLPDGLLWQVAYRTQQPAGRILALTHTPWTAISSSRGWSDVAGPWIIGSACSQPGYRDFLVSGVVDAARRKYGGVPALLRRHQLSASRQRPAPISPGCSV